MNLHKKQFCSEPSKYNNVMLTWFTTELFLVRTELSGENNPDSLVFSGIVRCILFQEKNRSSVVFHVRCITPVIFQVRYITPDSFLSIFVLTEDRMSGV